MGAHTEALRPTEDNSSSSDEAQESQVTTATDNDNVICVELVSVRSTSPRGIMRDVFDGTTPGVPVNWCRVGTHVSV